MLPRPTDANTALIQSRLGPRGDQWLAQLPEQMREVADAWDLQYLEACPGGWYSNLVWKVRHDGVVKAFKTGLPEPELFTEIAVLKRWQSRSGCVQLERFDENSGLMLMQCIAPGTSFRNIRNTDSSVGTPDLFEQIPLQSDTQTQFPTY